VFNLLTKCFYDKKSKPEYAVLRNYRKSLLENNNTIEVTDFGAGSKVFKSNTRVISKIAKTAGIAPKRAELLFRITNYLKPDPSDSEQAKQSILEIGTSLGLATSALSLGNLKAKIITLEGCPETAKIAQLQFQKFNCNNVESIITAFNSYLEKWNPSLNTATEHYKLNTEHFSLIYFDGNHSKKVTVDYFELLLSTITNETVWIFDDIHWSPEMEEAWKIIKTHPKVTITIDTFQWGLVFFRREQPKEHFIIRV
jgi:predicted O-methyltransferase YrrM